MLYKVSVSFHLDYIKITGDQIEIGIMEEPVKGKANVAMTKKIADHFGIPRSQVRIIRGEKSKDKIIKVIQ
jgi:uncharacterized protein YggU (UPF0235/DUF167 family)